MLREIALIEPEDWDAGPERVAERIAEIEARYAPEPIDPAAIRAQAVGLSAQPELVRVTAEGLALQIEDWRTEVLRALGANALPDELRSMEAMPAILRGMSLGAQLADKDKRIAALEVKIAQLIAEVEALRAALAEAKKNGKESIFSDAFKAKAGENCADLILSRKTWGFLGAGVWTLCGGPVGETTLVELLKLVMK